MTGTVTTVISREMQRCIDDCLGCHATCEATLGYCMAHGRPLADPPHILLLLDCAEICRTSAGFLLRGSALHTTTCAACATICTECADWCDRLQRDAVMKQCGITCRECAGSCEVMARTG